MLSLLLISMACAGVLAGRQTANAPYHDKNGAYVVPLNGEHTKELYDKWSQQGVSSVISALANNRLKTHRNSVRKAFGDCAKTAADVSEQARCLSRLEAGDFSKPAAKTKPWNSRLERLRPKDPDRWVGDFRTARRKRSLAYTVHRQDGYRMKDRRSGTGPFGQVAHSLLNSVLESKNKGRGERWQDVMEKARRLQMDKKGLWSKMSDSDEDLNDSDPLKLRSLIKAKFSDGTEDLADSLTQKLDKLDSSLTKPEDASRILKDIVKMKKKPRTAAEKLSNLLKEAVKMSYNIAGRNTSDFDERSMRIVSPRFFSLMPEQKDGKEVEFASPSLLSLHNQGRGIENLTSIPSLMQGMSEADRQAWLDLVVEASGVNDQLDDVAEMLKDMSSVLEDGYDRYRREIRTADGKPLYFTKQNVTKMYGRKAEDRIDHWEEFDRLLSNEQLRELNRTGFAVMSPRQRRHIYGAGSPYHDEELLRKFSALDDADVQRLLRDDVRRLAEPGTRLDSRLRDTVLSPVSFVWQVNSLSVSSSTILSPVMFSPLVLRPTILGPMIVSPWIFTPMILSPKLLSPLIIAPYIFSPLILSPLVLHPQILSPGVFNPHVLTPFAVSPLVLTPQVFSPLILCPLVLSPVVLNPTVGSPKVLSPFVLSPAVFSPQALSALVLSPYALSPVFYSKVYFFRLILSPSWLS